MKAHVLHKIHQLIKEQKTGRPEELAQKINLSERSVYNYLGYMRKELLAPIGYDAQKMTYYYYKEPDIYFVWLGYPNEFTHCNPIVVLVFNIAIANSYEYRNYHKDTRTD